MPPPAHRILCVDDNDDTCFMLSHLLKQAGYQMQSVSTARAALWLAETGGFNFYLLDNHLPDSDGLELCREMRAIHPDIPIVIYSGDAYPKHHRAAIEAGATAYVDKPNIDRLLSTLKDLLPN